MNDHQQRDSLAAAGAPVSAHALARRPRWSGDPASPFDDHVSGEQDPPFDWFGFARRQWYLMFLVWSAVMALSIGALWHWPKKYESSAKFLIKNARQDLVVGPNDTATQAYRSLVSEEVLNTELELLRSRDLLARVVGELDLDAGHAADGQSPAVAAELALRQLSSALDTSVLRKTNIVYVAYEDRDPERAAAVVRHVADAYLAAHLTMHSTPGSYELFQQQAADANVQLFRAEAEMSLLARTSNLVNLGMQKEESLRAIADLEAQLAAVAAELREQETRARVADTRLVETPERVPTQQRVIPNQSSVERLHTMLAELTNKRTTALTKFNANDRFVTELDQQIADTSAALESARQLSANEQSTDINPTWQNLVAERTKARLQAAGLESRAAQLRRELGALRGRMVRITEDGPRYEQVARTVQEARNRYELYAKKEEEARIADALDRQRISNVVLAQAPVVSHVASSPNLRAGLAGGGMAALFAAMAAGLAREMLRARRPARAAGRNFNVLGVSPAAAE